MRSIRTGSGSDRVVLTQKRRASWPVPGRYPLPVVIKATLPADMINCSEIDGALVFKVRVVPRASRTEIIGEHDGALRVRIAAPPVDGAANEELVRLLASAFSIPRSAIEILAGHTSKLKTLRVVGLDPAMLTGSLTINNDPRDATKYD